MVVSDFAPQPGKQSYVMKVIHIVVMPFAPSIDAFLTGW